MKKVFTKILIMLAFVFVGLSANAQITQLWGNAGGNATDSGTVFRIYSDGSGYAVLHNCTNPTGWSPYGNIIKATDGKLYGLNSQGGSHGLGTIFNFGTVNHTYTDLFDFYYSASGYTPFGSLIQATDGKLYGMTSVGGCGACYGVIFSYDPATNIQSVLKVFSSVTTGKTPKGNLIQAIDGKLYGMTSYGGTSNYGVIFSYNISANTYTVLYNFSGGAGGANPVSSLIQLGNGKLYGMTEGGGVSGYGNIFSFDPATNTYMNLFDMALVTGGGPQGNLYHASNGKLYGMGGTGGNGGHGVIFSFDTTANTYDTLHNFYTLDGSGPRGSLIQASNSKLYGMTGTGGVNNSGVIFNIDISTNIYTKIHDFTSGSGMAPHGDLLELPFSTDVEELFNSNGISIYPNPATTLLNIHHSTCTSPETLLITDLLGTVVYKENLTGIDNTISISTWSNGIYFYEVRGQVGSVRGKFVKGN